MPSPPLDRLLVRLASDDPAKRREAIGQLDDSHAAGATPRLFRMRQDDSDPEIRALAHEALERLGAVVDLRPIGADGWFEQIRSSSPAFETLCEVMGERFVGYALIAGAQITGLTIDQLTPANTVVEFRVGDNGPSRSMLMPDFRRQLVDWMLSESPPAERGLLPLDLAGAQRLVGVRYILLAPLHQIQLTHLVVEEPGEAPLSHVLALVDGEEEEIEVTTLRSRLREGVRLELARVRDRPFQLDMDLLDKVEAAVEAEDWEEVIHLIGGWPGPLSLLLRTPTGAALDSGERARIGRGLGMLAEAYRATGRSAWAEELLRLGLQFVNDGVDGADLFARLGLSMVSETRFGEAIAPLRRALALGAPVSRVGPSLGRCFVRRRRCLAAVVVLEDALEAGCEPEQALPYLKRAIEALGEAARTWREAHAGWTQDEALASVEPALDEDEAFGADESETTGRHRDPRATAIEDEETADEPTVIVPSQDPEAAETDDEDDEDDEVDSCDPPAS